MFGYIVPNQEALSEEDRTLYREYYCGLCSELHDRYGRSGQVTLSYDAAFLVLLLTSLYEEEEEYSSVRCLLHPLHSHNTRRNQFTAYAADMNLLLSYYSCLDDWNDERSMKKRLLAKALEDKAARVSAAYEKKVRVLTESLDRLSVYEKENSNNLDSVSGSFGAIMAELFAYNEDEWEGTLRRMGFFMGKFIYLLDAYDDMKKDRRYGSYNPLLLMEEQSPETEEKFDDRVGSLLTMMIGESSRAFERLPILENIDLLRNILYSGIWSRYNTIRASHQSKKGNQSDV